MNSLVSQLKIILKIQLLYYVYYCSLTEGSYLYRDISLRNETIKPFYGCETSAYPPNSSAIIPTYTIDLSLQPLQRWTALVQNKKPELVSIIKYVVDISVELFGNGTLNMLLSNMDKLLASLPSPYREEIKGIADASGVPVSEITFMNVFYEMTALCTSIIAQDPQGQIFHGRNLDFGIFLGWNSSTHEWRVAQLLRPLVVNLQWRRSNGPVLYSSVGYVGHIGALTAIKEGAFSLSVDMRFSWNGGLVGILEWLVFGDHNQRWLSFLTRETLESATTYDDAKRRLATPRLLAPVYFILAGTKPGEGCIITRYRDDYDQLDLGSPVSPFPSWCLVETNYDHWVTPPVYDDRRSPAIQCLKKGYGHLHRTDESKEQTPLHSVDGSSNYRVSSNSSNATLSLLYNVLSTRPVLNKLTTFTTLMSAGQGFISTWQRDCPDPCWPW